MKRWVLSFLGLMGLVGFLSFSVLAQPALADPKIENRIVALVGKVAITEMDLEALVKQAKLKMPSSAAISEERLRAIILDRMIDEEILVQQAIHVNIQVTNQEIDRMLKNIAQQKKMTIEAVKASLFSQAMARRSLNEILRRQVLIHKLRYYVIAEQTKISDQEINEQIKRNGADLFTHQYRLRKTLFQSPKDQALAVASAIKKALLEVAPTQSLSHLSPLFKKTGTTVQQETLRWMPGYTLSDQLAGLVSPLQVNGYTALLTTAEGMLLFQLIDKKPMDLPRQKNQQYHVAHILIKEPSIKGGLKDNNKTSEAFIKIKHIETLLKKGASFDRLAKTYSEDMSRKEGGDLGWVNKGQTVGPFEAVFVKLPLNQVSEPVRTEYGWHLIKVLDTRVYDTQEAVIQKIVREKLVAQRAEDVFNGYIQQLRESMYIEKRLTP